MAGCVIVAMFVVFFALSIASIPGWLRDREAERRVAFDLHDAQARADRTGPPTPPPSNRR
jgi:hypothetical protein